jgi:predicted metal-dependent peptidase
MYGFKFTPREKIVKAKIQLQSESPFFSHLIMNMSLIEDKNIPSMGVNFNGDARYNPEWVETLTSKQLKGVLCHEVMHVALIHLLRLGKRNHRTWNIATDMMINSMILKDGFELPDGALLPKDHAKVKYVFDLPDGPLEIDVHEKVAEQIYEELLEKLPKCDCDCHGSSNNNGNSEDDNSNSESGDGNTSQDSTGCQSGNCCPCDGYGFDEHEYGQDLSEAEKQSIEKEWKGRLVDAATAAKARGNLPGHLGRLVDELLHPKLNWKALLYQYITKDILYNFTYSKPGKRSYSTGVYMPSEVKENLNIVVTIDTSGSISSKEYTEFMSEVIGIANAFEQINMDVLHWDTKVRKETKVTRNNQKELIEGEIPGGGGTYIGCLDEHYQKKQTPMFMVHLTDGYVEWEPKLPHCKHLFVISKHGDGQRLKEYGSLVQIHEDT